MKILELRPAAPELSPRVERLARTLVERGHEVEGWSPDPGAGAIALAERLARVDFDLVHAHGELAAHTLVGDRRPVVTTLYAPPTTAEAAFLEQQEPPACLVRAFGAFAGEGDSLVWRARVDEESEAAAYLELFEAVHAEHRARRADALHDERPWGAYWVLDDQPDCKVKRITVHPEKRLSYQRHRHRSEHWLVVAGRGRVTLDGQEHELGPGDSIDIAAGQAHRMANPGDEPLTFIEVQRGTYFGEDDIERLEDDFGR